MKIWNIKNEPHCGLALDVPGLEYEITSQFYYYESKFNSRGILAVAERRIYKVSVGR